MATELDRLLARIHPARTLEESERKAAEAMNSFPLRAAVITDYYEFRSLLIRLHDHVEAGILGIAGMPEGHEGLAWSRCFESLRSLYGRSADKAAFEIARTGSEGGLYGVCSAVARTVAQAYARRWVKALIWQYWNGLDVEGKDAAVEEYLTKHGHLLPAELTEGSQARVRADFPTVLETHVDLMRRLGHIGRS